MSSTPQRLEPYIIAELSAEFDITNQETLQKMAAALSRAIHTYITTDVEVEPGQQVTGQDSLSGPVRGQTVTPGDLF